MATGSTSIDGPPWWAAALLSGALWACTQATPEDASGDRGPTAKPAANRSGPDAQALLSGKVWRLEIHLDEGAMGELAREPRDYVKGAVTLGDQRLERVAIRFKGHRSLRSWAGKPAFKLNFGKYEKGQRLAGLRSLSLNNMVEDPTLVREQLGYRVFRALGAPAPRTGYAEVFVNRERMGLYTLVEPLDGPFVTRFFRGANPLVYEGEYGCDVYPEDVWGMQLQTGDDPGRTHLSALAHAASGPVMASLEGGQARLQRAHFLAFLAASVWVGDFDGYRHGHNYRLYRDDATGLWSLIPWGLDRALDRPLGPYEMYGRLATRCFGDRACRLAYVQAMQRALDTLDGLGLQHELDTLAATIEPAARRDGRKPHGKQTRLKEREKLRAFLRDRSAKLRAQLDCWDGTRELDRDSDGYGCMDCDDRNDRVHPGQPEVCDGVDRDCSGQVDDAPACGCQPLDIDGTPFALCDHPRPWPEAKAFCEARGQVLAFFDDARQARRVGKLAEAVREDDWWIGLHDRDREGRAEFLGSGSDFRHWASGEPDDYACGQDCGALKENAKGRFRDLHCASRLPFVCRDLPPPRP